MTTLSDARDDVLTLLGLIDDGANNPALLTMIDRALSRAQRLIVNEVPATVAMARYIFSNWPAGTWYQDLPAAVRPEWIRQVTWVHSDYRIDLKGGIPPFWQGRDGGTPLFWQAMSKHLATGTDPAGVADSVLALDPPPDDTANVWVDYEAHPVDLVNDADVLTLERDPVVYHAAREVAKHVNPMLVDGLHAEYERQIRLLRGRNGNRSGWNFVGEDPVGT